MTIAPQSTAQQMTEETAKDSPAICRVVIIGHAARREFAGLAKWLCQHPQIQVIREFADIDAALARPEPLEAAQLTIVLQSSSDQYSAPAVNQLIGRTLFHRLLCCYGPWCESDGRSRNSWPDAVRVPLRLAESVIEQEFRRIQIGTPPIPPTSSRDEIFAHRLGDDTDTSAFHCLQRNAVAIGPDHVFRKTVTMTLQDFGLRTVSLPLIKVDPRIPIRPQQTPQGPIHVVLHDLDPWGEAVRASLNAARQRFPSAKILGLATMPDAGMTAEIFDEQLDAVIPKLDMHHGLNWHLQRVLEAQQG